LRERVDAVEGHPSKLFDGTIRFTGEGSGYISDRAGVPGHSVAFWAPDMDLAFQAHEGYYYFGEGQDIARFKYVGFATPVETIPARTLVRVSLARWWAPDEEGEERCYCQLSGWFG
jgi:hypothetical protein